jgi:drug/metabolite transporter (DMT)-like permease
VETVIVFRALSPIIVAFMDALCLGREWPNYRSWAGLITLVIGAYGYASFDEKFQTQGYSAYFWPALYCVIIASEMVSVCAFCVCVWSFSSLYFVLSFCCVIFLNLIYNNIIISSFLLAPFILGIREKDCRGCAVTNKKWTCYLYKFVRFSSYAFVGKCWS